MSNMKFGIFILLVFLMGIYASYQGITDITGTDSIIGVVLLFIVLAAILFAYELSD